MWLVIFGKYMLLAQRCCYQHKLSNDIFNLFVKTYIRMMAIRNTSIIDSLRNQASFYCLTNNVSIETSKLTNVIYYLWPHQRYLFFGSSLISLVFVRFAENLLLNFLKFCLFSLQYGEYSQIMNWVGGVRKRVNQQNERKRQQVCVKGQLYFWWAIIELRLVFSPRPQRWACLTVITSCSD